MGLWGSSVTCRGTTVKKEMIVKLHTGFEQVAHVDTESGVEFWAARDLQELLGYTSWDNFRNVVSKAATACVKSGYKREDHFLDAVKMVEIGSGAVRRIEDIMLTRYACYLIAQNGDPNKEQIAFAQTYFAVQTRKQEIIEQRLTELERVNARRKLTDSESRLSGAIYERIGRDDKGFAIIRSKGDQALFGGRTTEDMKRSLGVPKARPLADFLPTITIKAKDFANEITTFNINRDNLRTREGITREHIKSNEGVRRVLEERGIKPEQLPPDEGVKKIERRMQSEQKKLPKQVEGFGSLTDETSEG